MERKLKREAEKWKSQSRNKREIDNVKEIN